MFYVKFHPEKKEFVTSTVSLDINSYRGHQDTAFWGICKIINTERGVHKSLWIHMFQGWCTQFLKPNILEAIEIIAAI